MHPPISFLVFLRMKNERNEPSVRSDSAQTSFVCVSDYDSNETMMEEDRGECYGGCHFLHFLKLKYIEPLSPCIPSIPFLLSCNTKVEGYKHEGG